MPRPGIDPHDVTVLLEARLPPPDPHPVENVTHYKGRILLTDEDVEEQEVGSFVAREVHAIYEDADDDRNFEVMDDEQTLHELDCIIQEHWESLPMEGDISGLVFIENLKIDPAYRGRGIGAAALDRLLEHWGRHGGSNPSHIFLKAYPIESLKWKETPDGSEVIEDDAFLKGRDRLRRLYERVGFQLIPGTDYMVLCTAYERRALTGAS